MVAMMVGGLPGKESCPRGRNVCVSWVGKNRVLSLVSDDPNPELVRRSLDAEYDHHGSPPHADQKTVVPGCGACVGVWAACGRRVDGVWAWAWAAAALSPSFQLADSSMSSPPPPPAPSPPPPPARRRLGGRIRGGGVRGVRRSRSAAAAALRARARGDQLGLTLIAAFRAAAVCSALAPPSPPSSPSSPPLLSFSPSSASPSPTPTPTPGPTPPPAAPLPSPAPSRAPSRAPSGAPTQTPTTPAPTLAPTPQPGSNVLTFGTVFNALPCEQGEATRSELRQHLLLQANVTDAKVDAPICSSVRLDSEMTFSNGAAAMGFNDVLTSPSGINSVFGPGSGWNGTVPDNITEVVVGAPGPASNGGSTSEADPVQLPIIAAAVGGVVLILAAVAGYWFCWREESRVRCRSCCSDCCEDEQARPKSFYNPGPKPKSERTASPRLAAHVESSANMVHIGQAPTVTDIRRVGQLDQSFLSPTAAADGNKLPLGWTQHFTEQGAVYYYNAESGESTWTKPK
mmetsp:Transcript_8069/g.19743  ORF Transcript_8069/g.19743 Transcript_8069/m.19743 type:complete len:514 (-) Transcript_8069:523-2064(-)